MAETDFSGRVCMLLSADSSMFTAEMIESFDFRGTAEMLVRKAVPDYEDILSGDDEGRKKLLESCIVVQTAILRKTYIRCRAADIDDSPCVFQRTGCRFGYRYLDAVLDGLNGQRPSLVVGADNRARTAGG